MKNYCLAILLLFSFSAYSDISPVSQGDSIKASKFNEVVNKVNSLDVAGVDIQSVYFGASANDCSSPCTTGTCGICHQAGSKITSVTWVRAGTYRLNGLSGLNYSCTGSGYVGGDSRAIVNDRPAATANSTQVYSGPANTGYNQVICVGFP